MYVLDFLLLLSHQIYSCYYVHKFLKTWPQNCDCENLISLINLRFYSVSWRTDCFFFFPPWYSLHFLQETGCSLPLDVAQAAYSLSVFTCIRWCAQNQQTAQSKYHQNIHLVPCGINWMSKMDHFAITKEKSLRFYSYI